MLATTLEVMHIIKFIEQAQTTPDFPELAVIKLQSESYPALFLAQCINALKTRTLCTSLDTEIHKLNDIKAQLETSFLGNRMIYWVKNIHTLDATSKKHWQAYVSDYQGPHCIIYWSQAEKIAQENAQHLYVDLPTQCDSSFYRALYAYLYPNMPLDQFFLKRMFNEHSTIALDELCLLMAYQNVVGKNSDAFFGQWLSKIVVPETSLFALSQHLFARQPRLLFEQWKAVKNDFPDEFWVAYWSEQLWQAALFVMRAHAHGYEVARKSALKLPFSFMNKDWQKYTQKSLVQAHQFLYKLDHKTKNSVGTHGIELWYHKFLVSGQF